MKKNWKKFWKLGSRELGTHHFDIDKNSTLVVREGNYQYKIMDLVKRFGTPLEVVFPSIVEERVNHLLETFSHFIKSNQYKGKFFFHYPLKVNQNKEFVLPIVSEGGHMEVGSANELWIIKRIWEQEHFSSKIRVFCNGPKTRKYLGLIEELNGKGLYIVPVIENNFELDYLRGYRGDVGIRVEPALKIKSYWDKKIDQFGFPFKEILELGRIRNLKVLHYHAGSQIESQKDLVATAKLAMEYFIKIKKINPSLDTIDLGGGMAIPYEKGKMYKMENVVKGIVKTIKAEADKAGISHPNIVVEWGRYVVAPAQITIFGVPFEKSTANSKSAAKKWYFIDGSFINDLPDTWAIHQKWHVVPVNYIDSNSLARVWFAGSSCDSDDKYTKGGSYLLLPKLENLENGDMLYVAFFDTGAYQDPLSSHHCLLSNPSSLIAQNGVITVARKRETPEDMGKLFGW
jgi:arginine decarboxylase